MVKKIMVIVLTLFAVVALTACGSSAVAKVNGESVTVDDFDYYWENLSGIYEANDETLDDDTKDTVVDQLVYYKLLEQTAEDLDCVPADDETQSYFQKQLADLYGSYDDGLEEIEGFGLDQEFFYDQYRYELMENKIMAVLGKEQDVTVTQADAQEIYDADPESYNTRKVSQILIKPYAADNRDVETDDDGNEIYTDAEWQTAYDRAEKMIAQLEDGKSFATLAIKYSDDTTTAASGGVIDETLTEDNTDLEAAFVTAAFTLDKAGDYTLTPVKTSDGYHIIYCNEALSPNDMDTVLAAIVADQTELKEQELLTTYMDKQKDAAKIEYDYDAIE